LDRTRALIDIEPLALGKLVSQRRVETPATWWVYLPPFASKAAADKRASDLKAAGQRDAFVVDGGPQRLAISLGVFRTEDAANAWAAALAKQGIPGAKAGPRQQAVSQSLIVIRDPQQAVIAKLRELAPAYPGAETKIGDCEKPT
jgi:hypothetical protein